METERIALNSATIDLLENVYNKFHGIEPGKDSTYNDSQLTYNTMLEQLLWHVRDELEANDFRETQLAKMDDLHLERNFWYDFDGKEHGVKPAGEEAMSHWSATQTPADLVYNFSHLANMIGGMFIEMAIGDDYERYSDMSEARYVAITNFLAEASHMEKVLNAVADEYHGQY